MCIGAGRRCPSRREHATDHTVVEEWLAGVVKAGSSLVAMPFAMMNGSRLPPWCHFNAPLYQRGFVLVLREPTLLPRPLPGEWPPTP